MRRTGVTDRLRASTYLLYANFVSVDGAMEESVSEFLVREEVTLDMKAINPFILHDTDRAQIPLNLYNHKETNVLVTWRREA